MLLCTGDTLMQDQTVPEEKIGKFRRWLISIGLVAPPKREPRFEQQEDTEQQRQAKQDLMWHQLRPPRGV
jgi:hypothetical protein